MKTTHSPDIDAKLAGIITPLESMLTAPRDEFRSRVVIPAYKVNPKFEGENKPNTFRYGIKADDIEAFEALQKAVDRLKAKDFSKEAWKIVSHAYFAMDNSPMSGVYTRATDTQPISNIIEACQIQTKELFREQNPELFRSNIGRWTALVTGLAVVGGLAFGKIKGCSNHDETPDKPVPTQSGNQR